MIYLLMLNKTSAHMKRRNENAPKDTDNFLAHGEGMVKQRT
jgi:hypothetical protein